MVVVHAYDYNDELTKQGSGVVLNDKGYIDIIGIDVEKDILILKIKAKKFPAVKVGNSKSLKIGQRVYAIGSPMGFENTISEGIISGLRSYDELRRKFIQITASISSGSSGGAVVNDKGELIGISTLTVKESQNLNFAIPIDDVLKVEIRSYTKNDEYKDFELFDKGYNAAERSDYYEAIKYYSLYIGKYPNEEKAYNNRGNAKCKLEDYSGAIQDFNKAIELKQNDAWAYNNRGAAKDKSEDYRGAIQDYNRAIEIDPNDAGAYYNRGIAKRNLEDYRGAIQDYNKAIEFNPNFATAYNNRGIAKSKLKDYRGAIQDFKKAIELNPNFAGAYYNRGIAKTILGDKAGACLDWSKAGELGYDEAYEFIKKFCN